MPTVAESSLPGYAATGWYAMFGLGYMPKRLVNKNYEDVLAVIRRPDVAVHIRTLGFDYGVLPPEEFSRYIVKELATWGAVIKDAGIRAK